MWKLTARPGSRRTATSRSTWFPAAAAPTAATGARSLSTGKTIISARRARVAEEMLFLKLRSGPIIIWFADDIFALSPHWTREFADAVEALGARIPFKMQSRCDLMTRDTVAALRRAGCAEVWMGAESGSQKILDAMEKGMRVEQIYSACENLRRHGIRAGFFLQFGYPGEEWDDIQSDHPHGARDAARRYRRLRVVSSAGHEILSTWWKPSLARRRTGTTATIWR